MADDAGMAVARGDLFTPDSARAAALNRILAERLSQSLATLANAACDRYGEPGAEVTEACGRIARAQAADPMVFATYFDIVEAARREDRDALRPLWIRLCGLRIEAPPLHVVRWGDPASPPEWSAAMGRAVNADPTTRVALAPLAEPAYARSREALYGALGLLEAAVPELAREFAQIVRIVFLADCDPSGGIVFDGASSFHCAGALFLNAAQHTSGIDMVDALSHEAGHGYLFALGQGAPFIENGLEARFPSPLRAEPRPLEGVFHAAFVSARRCYALGALIDGGVLGAQDQDGARRMLAEARRAFHGGVETLERHAVFTPTGRRLLDDALASVG